MRLLLKDSQFTMRWMASVYVAIIKISHGKLIQIQNTLVPGHLSCMSSKIHSVKTIDSASTSTGWNRVLAHHIFPFFLCFQKVPYCSCVNQYRVAGSSWTVFFVAVQKNNWLLVDGSFTCLDFYSSESSTPGLSTAGNWSWLWHRIWEELLECICGCYMYIICTWRLSRWPLVRLRPGPFIIECTFSTGNMFKIREDNCIFVF